MANVDTDSLTIFLPIFTNDRGAKPILERYKEFIRQFELAVEDGRDPMMINANGLVPHVKVDLSVDRIRSTIDVMLRELTKARIDDASAGELIGERLDRRVDVAINREASDAVVGQLVRKLIEAKVTKAIADEYEITVDVRVKKKE